MESHMCFIFLSIFTLGRLAALAFSNPLLPLHEFGQAQDPLVFRRESSFLRRVL